MTTLEVVKGIADYHNIAAQILVSGDNAILMARVLHGLRSLASQIQQDGISDEKRDGDMDD